MTKSSVPRIERRRSRNRPPSPMCEIHLPQTILPGETVEVEVIFLANGDTVQHLLREDGSRARLNSPNSSVTP